MKEELSLSIFGSCNERVVRRAKILSLHGALMLAFLVAGLTILTQRARAQTESVLYSFAGRPDGYNPHTSLVQDAKANLYGTTTLGGAKQVGTVFEVTPTGTESVLYGFRGGKDGKYPGAGLVRNAKGNLYGTTYQGGSSGNGTVFEVTPAGTEMVLYTFRGRTDGANPEAILVLDNKGNLYGTTYQGGSSGNGTVFKVTPAGTETVLYSFSGGADGENPEAGLVRDTKGNLYGTTAYGGASGYGTVFKVTPAGMETVLYSFTGEPDGATPEAVLVRDKQGDLYGTTYYGGMASCSSGCGTIFEVTPAGKEAVLYSFTGGADGAHPSAGLARDAKGNLYGTTVGGGSFAGGCYIYGCGVVFGMTPTGGESVLHSFTGPPDGAYPNGLLRDAKGNLYGTTADGGDYDAGAVFKVVP